MRALLFLLLLPLVGCPKAPRGSVPAPLSETTPPPSEEQRQTARVAAQATFAAMGDLLLHETVKRSAIAANQKDITQKSSNHEGFDALFEGIAPVLEQADYTFANLETPIAPKNNRGVRSMVFNASTPLLPALKQAGFDMVSFANNHVYDQGRAGFIETLTNLDQSTLDYVGAGKTCPEAKQAKIIEINAINVAFIAGTLVFNDDDNRGENEPCANALKAEEVIESAREARLKGAELVVLSVHWGREYRTKPQSSHVAMAHQLMDGGVDLLLGHHPHVLQPFEIYTTKDHRTALAVYSLGNAISNQSAWYVYNLHRPSQANTRDGVILMVDFVRINYPKTKHSPAQTRTELANVRAIPTWTLNESRMQNGVESPYIRVVPTHTLRERAETALETEVDDQRILALQKSIELYNVRLRQVASIIGNGFLAYPSPQAERED